VLVDRLLGNDYVSEYAKHGQMYGQQCLLVVMLTIRWLIDPVCGNIYKPHGNQTFRTINSLRNCSLPPETMLKGIEPTVFNGATNFLSGKLGDWSVAGYG
jgi:hypothetical protein